MSPCKLAACTSTSDGGSEGSGNGFTSATPGFFAKGGRRLMGTGLAVGLAGAVVVLLVFDALLSFRLGAAAILGSAAVFGEVCSFGGVFEVVSTCSFAGGVTGLALFLSLDADASSFLHPFNVADPASAMDAKIIIVRMRYVLFMGAA
jgi:hypothetical protein